MKKLFLFLLLCAFPLKAAGPSPFAARVVDGHFFAVPQATNNFGLPFTATNSLPAACNAPGLIYVSTTQNYYTCQSGAPVLIGGGGAGTVTSFSAGNLSPLFTTSVATATTTPALTFSLTNAGAGTVFGNPTGASAAPVYTAAPVLGLPGTTIGTLGFAGNTSGTVTVTPQAVAGSPTLTLPNTTGTFADGASAPLVLSATTGNLTCATCATTTNGGALSGTAPVAISAAGAISITGAPGQVLAGAGPAFTATPTLGVAGTTLGTLAFTGNTSGTITLKPQAAAGTWEWDWPITAGSAGQVLTSQGGAGTAMTWSAAGSGTVTNVATTSPITGGPITTTGTIACATCATTTNGGAISFDKSATGLINPTADATFTYINTSVSGLTLAGTAPASSAGAGTAATTLFNVNAVIGGATTGSATTAGVGSSPALTGGAGGSGAGGTNAVGGAGGSITITSGAGGASGGTAANSNGGNIVLVPGAAGTGGSGAAGAAGQVQVQGTGQLQVGLAGTTLGKLGLSGNTSGTVTIQPQAAAGTATLTLPNTTGTLADGASAPLALSATTGNLTCATCATTTNGGALSATSPVNISAAGVISLTTPLTEANGGTGGTNVNFVDWQKSTGSTTGNSTDLTLYSTSVASINSGACIRATVWWQHTTGTTATTYKVFFGATSITPLSASTQATFSHVRVTICNDPGSQTSQTMSTDNTQQGGVVAPDVQATPAETTSSAVTLKFTFNVANTDSITGKGWLVEKIY